jgi:hypothetical protein
LVLIGAEQVSHLLIGLANLLFNYAQVFQRHFQESRVDGIQFPTCTEDVAQPFGRGGLTAISPRVQHPPRADTQKVGNARQGLRGTSEDSLEGAGLTRFAMNETYFDLEVAGDKEESKIDEEVQPPAARASID